MNTAGTPVSRTPERPRLVVQKYGGTSVGSLDHIRKVAKHVTATVRSGHSVIVTISAMGEQTDDLLAMARALNARAPRREVDMLLTAGERISAALLAIALDTEGTAAVSLTGSQCGILTDETHGNARIRRITGERIRSALDQDKVVIVAGFQGVSPVTKEITTLGRGGTDLSAIALAASLGAGRCQLFKDVPGVLTADPRVVAGARVIPELHFSTMTTLAWNGASVLHPRGAHIAARYGLPFEIRSSIDLNQTGTLIHGDIDMESPTVTALAHRNDMALIELIFTGAKIPTAINGRILEWLWQQGESPAISQLTGEPGKMTTRHVLKASLVPDLLDYLHGTVREVDGELAVARRMDKLGVITVAGTGFQQSPETVSSVLQALPETPVLMESRNDAVMLCLPEVALKPSLQNLHQCLQM